jgi:hypothetical protein
MSVTIKKQKDRSPNFPFIPLGSALERARQFYLKEKRGIAPFKVAAEHWRYSAASSGAVQTAAALKSYGLMADVGSGPDRQLKLTDPALRILLDTRPESEERQTLLRAAALAPQVAQDIYDRWGEELPSTSSLRHYLVLDRAFGEQKADSVIKITKENYELARISLSSYTVEEDEFGLPLAPAASTPAPSPQNLNVSGAYPAGGGAHRQSSSPAQATAPQSISAGRPADSRAAPERLTFKGAEILIYFDGEPNFATLDFIERYIRLRKDLLESQPNPSEPNFDL